MSEELDTVNVLGRVSRQIVGLTAQTLSGHRSTVTIPQFRTLVVLYERPGITPAELTPVLQTSQPATSKMVRLLIDRGLIKAGRDGTDGRRRPLTLTDQGSALVRTVGEKRARKFAEMVKRLSDEEQKALRSGLEVLESGLGSILVSATPAAD